MKNKNTRPRRNKRGLFWTSGVHFISVTNYTLPSWAEFRLSDLPQKRSSPMHSTPSPAGPWSSPKAESYLRHSHLPTYPYHPSHVATLPVPFPWPLLLSRQTCFSLLDYSPCNARRSDPADSPPADNTPAPFSSNTSSAFPSIFL